MFLTGAEGKVNGNQVSFGTLGYFVRELGLKKWLISMPNHDYPLKRMDAYLKDEAR